MKKQVYFLFSVLRFSLLFVFCFAFFHSHASSNTSAKDYLCIETERTVIQIEDDIELRERIETVYFFIPLHAKVKEKMSVKNTKISVNKDTDKAKKMASSYPDGTKRILLKAKHVASFVNASLNDTTDTIFEKDLVSIPGNTIFMFDFMKNTPDYFQKFSFFSRTVTIKNYKSYIIFNGTEPQGISDLAEIQIDFSDETTTRKGKFVDTSALKDSYKIKKQYQLTKKEVKAKMKEK